MTASRRGCPVSAYPRSSDRLSYAPSSHFQRPSGSQVSKKEMSADFLHTFAKSIIAFLEDFIDAMRTREHLGIADHEGQRVRTYLTSGGFPKKHMEGLNIDTKTMVRVFTHILLSTYSIFILRVMVTLSLGKRRQLRRLTCFELFPITSRWLRHIEANAHASHIA